MTVVAFGLCSACSSGSSSTGGAAAHDSFTLQAGTTQYQYDCAEQTGEMGTPEEMRTLGCSWPASNPLILVDVHITSATAIHEQTIDLSTASPSLIAVYVTLVSGSGTTSTQGWYGSVQGTGGMMSIAPGARGTVVIHSFDPASGSRDVAVQAAQLPLDPTLTLPPALRRC